MTAQPGGGKLARVVDGDICLPNGYMIIVDKEFVEEDVKEINSAHSSAIQEDREWVAKRLIEWMKTDKPANQAFTEGPLRQMAYAVEMRVAKAVEEKTKALRETLEAVECEVAKVYCHITGGRMSKCNYEAGAVISEADAETDRIVQEEVREAEDRVWDEAKSLLERSYQRYHEAKMGGGFHAREALFQKCLDNQCKSNASALRSKKARA